jgi:hypothetical protein
MIHRPKAYLTHWKKAQGATSRKRHRTRPAHPSITICVFPAEGTQVSRTCHRATLSVHRTRRGFLGITWSLGRLLPWHSLDAAMVRSSPSGADISGTSAGGFQGRWGREAAAHKSGRGGSRASYLSCANPYQAEQFSSPEPAMGKRESDRRQHWRVRRDQYHELGIRRPLWKNRIGPVLSALGRKIGLSD